MKKKFTEEEIKYILISTLILGFCFSFRWRGSFSVNNWFSALRSSLIIIGLALSIKIAVQKYISSRISCQVEYKIWKSGLILALITTIASLGYIIWAAPGAVRIINKTRFRIGKAKDEIHPGPRDHALIAVAGVFVFFIFALIGKILLSTGDSIFGDKLLFIGSYLAIFNLIPFVYPHNTVPPVIAKGNLPTLEGVLIFFGSRSIWAFSFSFILISVLGFLFLGTGASLIIAIVGSILLFLLWYYYVEPWGIASPTSDRFYRDYYDTFSKKPRDMGKWKWQSKHEKYK
ncbi:MAG: hypothetical protein JSW73_04110 [Candidatus Woesearchaeota archaeon]|nr:MAG: hypothetical protein JSW73_04110 [Candidatus Woesearchaeota archaeon]